MWTIALLVLFLVVLARRGRLGPLEWDPHWRTARPALTAPAASGSREAERILAQRLVEGDLTPDDYYERLSLIQSR